MGGSGGSGGSDGASSSRGESTSADTTTTGAMNLAGAGGEGGTAGAPTDGPGLLTCASFPDDDPGERCEPKLRALLSSNEHIGLLRFEYDAGGRPTAVVDAGRAEALQYYTYDDAGQLTRFQSSCDGPTRDTCHWHYDLSYGEGGQLQTIDLSYPSTPNMHITYRYRSDGQLEGVDVFGVDDAGTLTPGYTQVYEYGDDDLLDWVTVDELEDQIEYSYVLEGSRVRVSESEHFSYGHALARRATIFDDLGLPAFGVDYSTDEELSFVVDGMQVLRGYSTVFGSEGVWSGSRFLVTVPSRVFPYRPFDLGPAAIADFSYEFRNVPFARNVAFSDDNLLEHVTFSCGSQCQGELDILRCGGVTIETTTGSSVDLRIDETNVFYYGCDDFVLPALPELPEL